MDDGEKTRPLSFSADITGAILEAEYYHCLTGGKFSENEDG